MQQSTYLYQLSSTGGYRLIVSKLNYSQPFVDPNVLLGSVNLDLDLSSINYPSKYNLLFYSAESLKSNEVRSPGNIMIRQREEELKPARIASTTGFSNDVINVTQASSNSNYYHRVSGERNQRPLFRVVVPKQTSLGIYTIPLTISYRWYISLYIRSSD